MTSNACCFSYQKFKPLEVGESDAFSPDCCGDLLICTPYQGVCIEAEISGLLTDICLPWYIKSLDFTLYEKNEGV